MICATCDRSYYLPAALVSFSKRAGTTYELDTTDSVAIQRYEPRSVLLSDRIGYRSVADTYPSGAIQPIPILGQNLADGMGGPVPLRGSQTPAVENNGPMFTNSSVTPAAADLRASGKNSDTVNIGTSSVVNSAPPAADSLTYVERSIIGRPITGTSEREATNVDNAARPVVAQDAALNESRTFSGESSPRTGGNTMPNILSVERMNELRAVQGTRGVLGSLVAQATMLTNGAYYVDVLAASPGLSTAQNRDGDALQYGDDDGNFSLSKLASAVKNTVDRKRKDAVVNGHAFPNIETIRDDDANTVYIVNWDKAPTDDGDDN